MFSESLVIKSKDDYINLRLFKKNSDCINLCPGMESLSQAVSYWEDAVMKMSYLDDQPYPAIHVSHVALTPAAGLAVLCGLHDGRPGHALWIT